MAEFKHRNGPQNGILAVTTVLSNIRLEAGSPFKRQAINGSSEGKEHGGLHFKQGMDFNFLCFSVSAWKS